MSIFAIQNTSPADSTDALTSLLQITQTNSDTTTSSDGLLSSSVSSKDSTHISKLARLFSKLQSLATSDPTKFQQVTADFAAKLNTEAIKIGGPQEQFLSKLADKFSQASQTGDVSVLNFQPPAVSKVPAAYSTNTTDVLSATINGGSSIRRPSENTRENSSSADTIADLFHQLDQKISGTSN